MKIIPDQATRDAVSDYGYEVGQRWRRQLMEGVKELVWLVAVWTFIILVYLIAKPWNKYNEWRGYNDR